MEAWSIYMEEFRRRGERASAQQVNRRELLEQAAHAAYQAAADRMTGEHDWGDEQTLVVMRGLNAAVQQWLDSGSSDWEQLGSEMRRREAQLREGFGSSSRPDRA
jgi:hypothetical protein